ncbi:MAG: hypothetical protein QW687_01600 [Candidatus Hadarchaeales archaeon]
MTVLRQALVTPRGIVLPRPLRLMVSPFRREGVALQTCQPWVGNPAALTAAQVKRTAALIKAATAAKGTYGVVFNPRTGRMMPAIAKKVQETIEGKLTPEERIAHRRMFAERYRISRRARAEYQAYLEILKSLAPEVAGAIKLA